MPASRRLFQRLLLHILSPSHPHGQRRRQLPMLRAENNERAGQRGHRLSR